MVAAAVGNAAAVDALVSAGATVDARDQDGTQVRVTAPVTHTTPSCVCPQTLQCSSVCPQTHPARLVGRRRRAASGAGVTGQAPLLVSGLRSWRVWVLGRRPTRWVFVLCSKALHTQHLVLPVAY